MRLIITLLFFTSCAFKPLPEDKTKKPIPRKSDNYRPVKDRELSCVKELIRIDVPPLDAAKICSNIFRKDVKNV